MHIAIKKSPLIIAFYAAVSSMLFLVLNGIFANSAEKVINLISFWFIGLMTYSVVILFSGKYSIRYRICYLVFVFFVFASFIGIGIINSKRIEIL